MYLYEKINKIKELKCEKEVYEYLKCILKDLKVEITSKYKKNDIFELMNKGALEGWCFQTSECCILFFKDDDYIQRGNLKSDALIDNVFPWVKYSTQKEENYYHSWIVFDYNNKEYVFDPCLQIISLKDDYYNIFTPDILGMVLSKDVKKYVIKEINEKKEEIKKESNILNFLNSNINQEVKERLDKEIVLKSSEDVNSPNYRNTSGYIINIEDDKILSLTAHYYLNA